MHFKNVAPVLSLVVLKSARQPEAACPAVRRILEALSVQSRELSFGGIASYRIGWPKPMVAVKGESRGMYNAYECLIRDPCRFLPACLPPILANTRSGLLSKRLFFYPTAG